MAEYKSFAQRVACKVPRKLHHIKYSFYNKDGTIKNIECNKQKAIEYKQQSYLIDLL